MIFGLNYKFSGRDPITKKLIFNIELETGTNNLKANFGEGITISQLELNKKCDHKDILLTTETDDIEIEEEGNKILIKFKDFMKLKN